MPFKLHRSPVIGTGLGPDDPKRSLLTNYITAGIGGNGTLKDWIHDGREVRYALVETDVVTLNAIDSDPNPELIALSPNLIDLPAIDDWLNGSGIEFKSNQILKGMLEADAIPTSWITGLTTRRDVFRYMSKLHVAMSEMHRIRRESSALNLIKSNSINSSLSSANNTHRADFDLFTIEKKGSSHGLPQSAKISQAVLYLIEAGTVPAQKLGPLTF